LKFLRLILFPITFLYGCIVFLHRILHRIGFLKTAQFNIKIINIGNLSIGGTGKSPHVEYIHQIVAPFCKTAIVSRGYKRKTSGVKILSTTSNAIDVGDEPLQFKLKFPTTPVVVAEKRAAGIQYLLQNSEGIKCILLDDAFQHWAIQASSQVLLSTFGEPFFNDYVVPSGNLREFRSGYKRADIIIITKCPAEISEAQKNNYLKKIKPLSHQKVFFSYFEYQNLYLLADETKTMDLCNLSDKEILVVTAIADTKYLEQSVNIITKTAGYLRFSDHHYFSATDMKTIKSKGTNRLIITTQKDATRMIEHLDYIRIQQLDIYVLPIEVKIAFEETDKLKKEILSLVQD
jgi:tetraacyldisaccharide 4'-kinase